MTLALFWERSNLGFVGAGSAMMVLGGRRKAQLQDVGWDKWCQCVSWGVDWVRLSLMKKKQLMICIALLLLEVRKKTMTMAWQAKSVAEKVPRFWGAHDLICTTLETCFAYKHLRHYLEQ